MDLLIHFDRKALAVIKKEFKAITKNNLSFIEIVDFCGIVIRKLLSSGSEYNYLTTSEGRASLLRSLCEVYFAVDIDFRCAITWVDFTAYCLRVIRNRFKLSARQSPIQYAQHSVDGPLIPAVRMKYFSVTNKLYLFDSDMPCVRVIGKGLGYDGNKLNPSNSLYKHINLYCMGGSSRTTSGSTTASTMSNIWRNRMPSPDKGTVLAMEYVSRTKQFVIATSDFFVSYWDSSLSRLIGFERVDRAQMGLQYCTATEMLLSWSNSGSDTSFNVINPVQRVSKYKVKVHKEYVLAACELRTHNKIVSSGIDRSVLLWPNAAIKSRDLAVAPPLNGRKQIGAELVPTFILEKEHSGKVMKLRGHKFAIHTLLYAPDNDVIIGSGFDFDVYAWDPNVGSLQMVLVGHNSNVVSISLVYTPQERVISCDDSCVVKVWNIDKALGHLSEQLQHIQIVQVSPGKSCGMVPAFNGGETVAVLADRVYYLEGHSTLADDIRPVIGGVGVSHGSNLLWVITRGNISLCKLSNGLFCGRLEFHNADRTDTTEVNKGTVKSLRDKVGKICTADTTSSLISPTDEITAATSDLLGKKIFVGTLEGHVFMFDASTFGLLRRLSVNHPHQSYRDAARNVSGKASAMSASVPYVADLSYISVDEILIVVLSNHCLKVYTGCYRTLDADQPRLHPIVELPYAPYSGIYNRSYIGGRAPGSSSALLRECRYECVPFFLSSGTKQTKPTTVDSTDSQVLHADESTFDALSDQMAKSNGKNNMDCAINNDSVVLCLAVSEVYHTIAVASDDGCIRTYNFLTMKLLSVYMAPKVRRPKPNSHEMEVEIAICGSVSFVPKLPVLVGADNYGRVSAWTIKPLNPCWLLTWCSHIEPAPGAKVEADASKPRYAAETSERSSRNRENCPTSTPITFAQCFVVAQANKKYNYRTRKSVLHTKEKFKSMLSRPGKLVRTASVNKRMVADEKPVNKKSSAAIKIADVVETLTKNYFVVVGDELGRVHTHDITSMIRLSGVLHEVSKLPKPGAMFPYHLMKRYYLYEGMDVQSCSELSEVIMNPIGAGQANLSTGFQGISVKDVVIEEFCKVPATGSIRSVVVLQEDGPDSMVRSQPGAPKNFIISTSTGVVKLYCYENKRCLGEISDGVLSAEELEKALHAKREKAVADNLERKLKAEEDARIKLAKEAQLKELELKKQRDVEEKGDGGGNRSVGTSKVLPEAQTQSATSATVDADSVSKNSVADPGNEEVGTVLDEGGIIGRFGWDFKEISARNQNIIDSMVDFVLPRIDDVIYGRKHEPGPMNIDFESPQSSPDPSRRNSVEWGDELLGNSLDELHNSMSIEEKVNLLKINMDATDMTEPSVEGWSQVLRNLNKNNIAKTIDASHMEENSLVVDVGDSAKDPVDKLWNNLCEQEFEKTSFPVGNGYSVPGSNVHTPIKSNKANMHEVAVPSTGKGKAFVDMNNAFETIKHSPTMKHSPSGGLVAQSTIGGVSSFGQLKNYQTELDRVDSLNKAKKKKDRQTDKLLADMHAAEERRERERQEAIEREIAEREAEERYKELLKAMEEKARLKKEEEALQHGTPVVESLDLSKLDDCTPQSVGISRKYSRGSSGSRSCSPAARKRPQSAPAIRKSSSTSVSKSTVPKVVYEETLAPNIPSSDIKEDKLKAKPSVVSRSKSASVLRKYQKKSGSMPKLLQDREKPAVTVKSSLFQHANGTVNKSTLKQSKPSLNCQFGHTAPVKPPKLTMQDKMNTLLSLFPDEVDPVPSETKASVINGRKTTDVSKKYNLYGAAHDGTYLSKKYDSEVKLDHLGLPCTDYLENDTTAVISSPGLEKRINNTLSKFDIRLSAKPNVPVLKRTTSNYSQKLLRQASTLSGPDKAIEEEDISVSNEAEVTDVDDEINHFMTLFAKQRITQEELGIALEKTKKKAGIQKMRTFGNFIRYGPYKSKDIFAFVRLLILLEDHKLMKQMQTVKDDGEDTNHFVDTDGLADTPKEQVPLAVHRVKRATRIDKIHNASKVQVYAHRSPQVVLLSELLHSPQVQCHYKLVRQLEMLNTTDNAVVNTEQLIPILFFHASEAERVRILTLIDCTYALWNVFKYSLTPPIQAIVGGKESKTSSANPKLEESTLDSPHPPPVTPHPTSGYEGFTMEQYRLMDLRTMFDNMHKCVDGTILGHDLADILLALSPENKQCRQLQTLSSTMHLNGIAPDKEVTGSSFNNFVKFCLKIKVEVKAEERN